MTRGGDERDPRIGEVGQQRGEPSVARTRPRIDIDVDVDERDQRRDDLGQPGVACAPRAPDCAAAGAW